jgi:hypothetical protein
LIPAEYYLFSLSAPTPHDCAFGLHESITHGIEDPRDDELGAKISEVDDKLRDFDFSRQKNNSNAHETNNVAFVTFGKMCKAKKNWKQVHLKRNQWVPKLEFGVVTCLQNFKKKFGEKFCDKI